MPNPSELARQEELTSFDHDNFSSRRTTGHNLYNPDATITQGELDAGFTPENSRRVDNHPNVHNIGPGVNLENLGPRVFLPGQDPNRTTKLSAFVERNTWEPTDSLYLESVSRVDSDKGRVGFAVSRCKAILPSYLHVWAGVVDRWLSLEQATQLRDWLTTHIDHANWGAK